MRRRKGEYARSGVDYGHLQQFKDMMAAVGKRTWKLPNARGVYLERLTHPHAAVWVYRHPIPHQWALTVEGLGNKNWIAEWMYMHAPNGGCTYYEGIGIDSGLMAVGDVIAQGAMPVLYADEVAAGDSDWCLDAPRSGALAKSYFKLCQMVGMALGAGESPALKYLINSRRPVKSAPSLSGAVIGIIAPASRLITGKRLRAGDVIIGARSSGLHSNGISLVIKRAMARPQRFLTVLDNGRTLGEEALIPTMSYVALVEALLAAEVEIHALLPGTGDGVAKLAFDKRPFTYQVHSWLPLEEIPPLFRYLMQLRVSWFDMLTTFNLGIGYYIFAPKRQADRIIRIGQDAGYSLMVVGEVKKGDRQTIFEPSGYPLRYHRTLPPPGD